MVVYNDAATQGNSTESWKLKEERTQELVGDKVGVYIVCEKSEKSENKTIYKYIYASVSYTPDRWSNHFSPPYPAKNTKGIGSDWLKMTVYKSRMIKTRRIKEIRFLFGIVFSFGKEIKIYMETN